MKKGYSVESFNPLSFDNCIIVDNYIDENCVVNTPLNKAYIKEFKDSFTIGVWKIKNKN